MVWPRDQLPQLQQGPLIRARHQMHSQHVWSTILLQTSHRQPNLGAILIRTHLPDGLNDEMICSLGQKCLDCLLEI